MSLPFQSWEPPSAIKISAAFLLPSLLLLFLPSLISFSPRLLPPSLRRFLPSYASYLKPFVTLQDLYPQENIKSKRAGWKTVVLSLAALVQLQFLLFSSTWRDEEESQKETIYWSVAGLLGACWFYAGVYPVVVRRTSKANYSLLGFYLLQLISSSLALVAPFYLNPNAHLRYSAAFTVVLDLVLLGTTLSLDTEDLPLSYLEDQKRLVAEGSKGYSPEDRSTLASWLGFSWVSPLIESGRKGFLDESDLWKLSPVNLSRVLFPRYDAMSNLSTFRRVLKSNGFDFLVDFVLAHVQTVLVYLNPYFLNQILDAIEDPTSEKIAKAYALTVVSFLLALVKVQTELNKRWFGRRASIRSNTQMASAIFQKSLIRKDTSGVAEGKGAGVGKIIQLMSNDAPRIATFDVSRLYVVPLELTICCTFLYSILSWSAFIGVATIVLLMPLQTWLTSLNFSLHGKYRKASDERTDLLTELINSIKVIKFFAWEQRWLDKIDDARARELKFKIQESIVSLVFSLSGTLTPMIVTVVSFFSFVQIQKRELTVSVAFTALSLFSMLRQPLNNLPEFVVQLSQVTIACRRIDAFLEEDEVSVGVSSLKSASLPVSTITPSDTRIGFVGARFKWNSGTVEKVKGKAPDVKTNGTPESASAVADALHEPPRVFELGDIDFIFPAGALTIISGPTGSGKTALLLSLLGETDLIKGSILLPKEVCRFDEEGLSNSIAYAGQTSWLQNLSIKENILFGSPFDEKRYATVLRACALVPDLAMLEDDDETEIGAKGVTLSGGQKARVALARAVYSRAKHVLLDDPLAAVDSHTAATLVSDCLGSALLKNRTVIIVSHHIELLLPIAHSVVHVVDGRVEAQGTVDALRANGHLSAIVAEVEKAHVDEETVVDGTLEKAAVGLDEVIKPKRIAKKLTEDEDRAQGRVKFETYKTYLGAVSYSCVAGIAILMIFSDNSAIVERWWIAIWTRPVDENLSSISALARSTPLLLPPEGPLVQQTFFFGSSSNSNSDLAASSLPSGREHPLFYLGVYFAISFGFVLTGLVRNLVGYLGKYRASKKLHSKLLRSIMRATPRWFDTTPTGRITNRFTSDMGSIDGNVLDLITMVARSITGISGSLFLILSLLPAFLVPAAILGYLFFHYTVEYIRCARDLQRMKAVALSPILSGFDSALSGIVVIRAFSAEKRFMEEFFDRNDVATAAEWWFWMCSRWVMARFDPLGAVATFATTLLVLYTRTSAGLGGMLILSSQGLTIAIFWLSRYWSAMEMRMNAVERVLEYSNIPQEARLLIPENAPPAYWPSNSGETLISVKNLVVSYDPSLPPVLHGISFDVKPREKIGLIGRTGSGKSTLGMSFLRFTEFTSGSITIDGIDISSIGLQNLREKVSIIPQDAVLFSGTIRSNLDPFQEHTDDELIAALHRVQLGLPSTSVAPSRAASTSDLTRLNGNQLKDDEEALKVNIVASGGKIVVTLDSEVSSGGLNFSQGQRQLIALARALLRNNLIVILDEASSSVDQETDLLIQQTIREEFTNSCLLTIAHRLSSIVDYDRLLVLDAGRVVEFDTPFALLSKKQGEEGAVFRGMAEKSGKFEELLRSAERKEKSERARG
ncbi:hypothetical protein BDY24DRAFT_218614 [Mrakia frigida]|uniref:uncharacterized protein n=1 Tax=Mrakia frigida TaxID=29902 RepID=UPI003FCBFF9C